MTAKQVTGLQAPDGAIYVCTTDGAGTLTPMVTYAGSGAKQLTGSRAPDGSQYITLTDGNGTLS